MPITREFINGRISFSVRTPKRKGITTLAVKIPLFYKEGRKSLTTIGFFKKSGDIFFGATSQKINTVQKTVFIFFFKNYAPTCMRPTANNSEGEAVANDITRGCHGRRADRGIFNAVKNERPCGSSPPAP